MPEPCNIIRVPHTMTFITPGLLFTISTVMCMFTTIVYNHNSVMVILGALIIHSIKAWRVNLVKYSNVKLNDGS